MQSFKLYKFPAQVSISLRLALDTDCKTTYLDEKETIFNIPDIIYYLPCTFTFLSRTIFKIPDTIYYLPGTFTFLPRTIFNRPDTKYYLPGTK